MISGFVCLGIETSCDETAAAVVVDGDRVVANVVRSQIDLHAPFEGVVPELACRAHVETIVPVIDRALADAAISLDRVDAIAVTHTPGLVGALLVGVSAAKALALATDKHLIGVDHIHAHIYACRLAFSDLAYPCVSLVVSGGHTSLYHSRSVAEHELLGSTRDDAAGEAFDKVAKMMQLPFPGGPNIEKAAVGGNPRAIPFVRTMLEEGSLDFSFSGLKTAVLYHLRGQNAEREPRKPEGTELADLAASFQEAVVDVLAGKSVAAAIARGVRSIAIGGGVACNTRLRESLRERASRHGITLYAPPPPFCTDNAAMVAGIGYHLWKRGVRSDLRLDAIPTKQYDS